MNNINRTFLVLIGTCLLFSFSISESLLMEEPTGNTLKSQYSYEHQNRVGLDQDRYITMKDAGLRVHYRIIGKGPIDIVFIPGWTNPLEIYTKQFDYFRKSFIGPHF